MANTLIGAGMTVEGEIVSTDSIVVEGVVKGKLSGKEAITLQAGGVIEADVEGSSCVVAGTIVGNIHVSDRVDLQSGSKVIGNVKAAKITIVDGAQFKGNVDMDV